MLTIALIAGTIASILSLVYWSIGLSRAVYVARKIPTAAEGARLGGDDPGVRVCVIIPAHNESSNITSLITSLRGQDHAEMRVILALDRCTDDTPALARLAIGDDARFEIIEIHTCPDGWAGKVNAIWQAYLASGRVPDAELLLFADADTTWHPTCLTNTIGLLRARQLEVLSLLCNVTLRRWWEWMVQPVAGLELLRQYPLRRSNREGCSRPFINGQFILIRREAYERIGGHESVHDQMLEDLALGRRVGEMGLRSGSFLAGGMVRCRMHESWAGFVTGWQRIYAEAARRRVRRIRRAAVEVGLFGTLMPTIALATVVAGIASPEGVDTGVRVVGCLAGGLALAAQAATIALAFALGGVAWWSVVAYPIGAALVTAILLRTARMVARRETTNWGGRVYQFAPE